MSALDWASDSLVLDSLFIVDDYEPRARVTDLQIAYRRIHPIFLLEPPGSGIWTEVVVSELLVCVGWQVLLRVISKNQ